MFAGPYFAPTYFSPAFFPPGLAAAVAELEATGGWAFWFAYEQEMARRDEERLERARKEAATEAIEDETEREIARYQRAIDVEEQRWLALERLRRLAEIHRGALYEAGNERVNKAATRAILKGNFSAMEALERELGRQREEEEFLLQAATILFTQHTEGLSEEDKARFLLESGVILGNQ